MDKRNKKDIHIIIDTSNIIYRSYFACEKQARRNIDKYGNDVTMLHFMLNMISCYIYDIGSSYSSLSFVFDGSTKRRSDKYSEYKSNRVKKYEIGEYTNPVTINDTVTVKDNITMFKVLMCMCGADLYYNENEESDDVIYSLAKKKSGTVVVVSDDQDFFQMVTKNVVLYRPSMKVGERFFDREKVISFTKEKYGEPVKPEGTVMFKALTGDKSDNIHGVYLLKKKVAAEASNFKTIDEVLIGCELTTNEKSKINEAKDVVCSNIDLVKLYEVDTPTIQVVEKDTSAAKAIIRLCLKMEHLDLTLFKLIDMDKSIEIEYYKE